MHPYQCAFNLLQTIPGIDAIAIAMILIEDGFDMSQFGDADRLGSWAALCSGNNESAGKRKSGKTRKGNAIVRYILCECANAARVPWQRNTEALWLASATISHCCHRQ